MFNIRLLKKEIIVFDEYAFLYPVLDNIDKYDWDSHCYKLAARAEINPGCTVGVL